MTVPWDRCWDGGSIGHRGKNMEEKTLNIWQERVAELSADCGPSCLGRSHQVPDSWSGVEVALLPPLSQEGRYLGYNWQGPPHHLP